MKTKKPLLISLFVLIGAGIIGVILAVIDFKVINPTKNYASETIQFDYDGASSGKDPNGNPFNPISFLTDEVISDALTDAGFNYDVEKVKQHLLMENSVPKDIVKEINSYTSVLSESDSDSTRNITTSDYYPVRYSFVLYGDLDKKLSKSDLDKLLECIVNSYCDAFYTNYQKDYDISSYENIFSIEGYDYIYQIEILTNKLEMISKYALKIYREHDDFKVNGKNFNDIVLKSNQYITSDVSRIRNIITLNALSKDIDRLKDYYSYKIEMLNYDKVKYNSDLTNVNEQLNAYTKDSTVYVSSGENIVKVESNSSATYNSLLAQKISLANEIATINTEISDYQSILDDINNAVATEEDYTLVKNYISKLSKDYDALELEFSSMVNEYNEEYVLNGVISKTEVSYHSSSIFSTSFIARCVKICAPICLVALLVISIYLLIEDSKKRKEKISE